MATEKIRSVTPEDAAAICDIYRPYVTESTVSFELVMPTVSEMQARILETMPRGWFVAEKDGKVVGYAYAAKHRERMAYQYCCEASVYIHPDHQRQGIAASLYRRLFAHLKTLGLVNVYAGITLPNPKSIAFHQAMGFEPIGTYKAIGYKFEAWHDVTWLGLRLEPTF